MAVLDGAKYCKQLRSSSSKLSACVSPDGVDSGRSSGSKASELAQQLCRSSRIAAAVSQQGFHSRPLLATGTSCVVVGKEPDGYRSGKSMSLVGLSIVTLLPLAAFSA